MDVDEKKRLDKLDATPGPIDVGPVEIITYEDEGADDGRDG